jgi:hypothetical protein
MGPVDGRNTLQQVVTELNTVPIFGIATENAKLYGAEGLGCMVYVHLQDAHRVLAQLQATYPESPFDLQPLELGTVLTESGLIARISGPRPRVTLVASSDARNAAKRLRAPTLDRQEPVKPASRRLKLLQSIPVFHIGTLRLRTAAAGSTGSQQEGGAGSTGSQREGQEQEELWPFFFEAGDVERMWTELGEEGAPCPPMQATDLAHLVKVLLEPRLASSGRPVVCAPLESVEYMRSRESEAARLADEASAAQQSA